MNTIIVPLDGSPLAEQALPYARALATITGAQLHLIQVVPEQRIASVYTPMLVESYAVGHDPADMLDYERVQLMETLRNQAAAYLAEQAHAMRSNTVCIESDVYVGDPAEVIVDVAARKSGAWIVMATHGYSGIRRWTLGSVTDKVIHAASVPVLVVRSDVIAPPSTVQFRNILVPLDGSALSQQALPLAVALAKEAGASLTLVRAISPTPDVWTGTALTGLPPIPLDDMYEALYAQAEQELATLAADLRAVGLHVRIVIESAVAANAIIEAAHRYNANLVIMATHGRSGIQRWALGSVADKVLHATITPLLLVRAQQHPN